MSEKTQLQATQTNPPTFRSSDYRIVFSNWSKMTVSPTEFAVTFGFISKVQVPGTPANVDGGIDAAEDRTTVILTPHHAKILALSLQGAVTAYEGEYGKIDISTKQPLGMDKIIKSINELLEQARE